MAKRKVVRKKNSRVHKGTNIEFNSWIFFIFLLFVLIVAMMLVAKQHGLRLF